MTVVEAASMVGRTDAQYQVDGTLSVPVSIKDTRHRFGSFDFLIEPINGFGERWVSEGKIKFMDWSV